MRLTHVEVSILQRIELVGEDEYPEVLGEELLKFVVFLSDGSTKSFPIGRVCGHEIEHPEVVEIFEMVVEPWMELNGIEYSQHGACWATDLRKEVVGVNYG